eukprot:TRINITY_DN36483_c0_g1_i1.p1 TRINITY_DN36483_c0_g1~~TRINITY_DN36483_c0_g1_i1.p1  ORF type:complete len:271 (+),score=20.29 TRINITY_DN36483_c0_g1_i1:278-1090(+)
MKICIKQNYLSPSTKLSLLNRRQSSVSLHYLRKRNQKIIQSCQLSAETKPLIRYKSESINNIENSKNDVDRRKLLVGSLMFFQTLQNVNSRESFGTTRTSSSCENVFAGSEFKNPGVDWVILNKDKQLFYPKWFQGEWETKAKLVGVKFPLGMKYINRQTPGVTQASIAVALPDVGAGQDDVIKYTSVYSFSELEGGVVADRYNNIKYLMESFLKDKVNQVAVDYDPAKKSNKVSSPLQHQKKKPTTRIFRLQKSRNFCQRQKVVQLRRK